MIVKLNAKRIDFMKTFKSGLFYFFYEETPRRKVLFDRKTAELSFRENEKCLEIESSRDLSNEKGLLERIRFCLGLDENLKEFHEICRDDPVLKDYIDRIETTRIFSAFSDFEALVGAIISQNNSYKNYRRKMLEVYLKLNFDPKKFTESNLEGMGLGYKVPFLATLAKDFGKKDLQAIRGIGPYSVQLYEIFQKRNYSAFYIDCLTEKIMRQRYGINKDFEEESWRLWGKWRGLAEAYLQRFFEKK
ncbi:MAG: hypothetical protein JW727_02060 [Candidatus Aenigmarchaeota archaeon]|nr:hypothetical protein [Candidatus Aenigmarchaeota archaeon]